MFITFEGIDGSGKSSTLEYIKKYILNNLNVNDFVFTREPGGHNLRECEEIRKLLLDNNNDIDPMSEALLYLSSRVMHVNRLIKPSIENNKIVLCDRFYDSSIAYQGGGRNLGIDLIKKLNLDALNNFKPDYTFYFKIDFETSQKRMKEANREFDRLENEEIEFFKKSIDAYDLISSQEQRFIIVDATRSKEEVFEFVLNKFKEIINNQ